MATTSDAQLLVLQGLRVRSFAETEVVAEAAGLPVEDVRDLLERFRDERWARHRDGVVSGWMLLPAGRAEGEKLLAAELDATGRRADVDAAYRRFLALNQRLLQACTDWQLRPIEGGEPVLNDHADAAYDAAVVADLRRIDDEVQPIASALADVLERFGGYPARFTRALEKTEAGDGDWFTKPTIDSYHTVWFELHENLLSTLGIVRGTEDPG
jgi:hypothetical protein